MKIEKGRMTQWLPGKGDRVVEGGYGG